MILQLLTIVFTVCDTSLISNMLLQLLTRVYQIYIVYLQHVRHLGLPLYLFCRMILILSEETGWE